MLKLLSYRYLKSRRPAQILTERVLRKWGLIHTAKEIIKRVRKKQPLFRSRSEGRQLLKLPCLCLLFLFPLRLLLLSRIIILLTSTILLTTIHQCHRRKAIHSYRQGKSTHSLSLNQDKPTRSLHKGRYILWTFFTIETQFQNNLGVFQHHKAVRNYFSFLFFFLFL